MNFMSLSKKYLPSRSIFNDLIISLSLAVLLVSIGINVMNFWATSKKFEQQFNDKTRDYISYLQNALAWSMWNFDGDNIQRICSSFLKNDLVGKLIVKNSDNAVLFNESKTVQDMLEFSDTISYDDNVIGYIELGLTRSIYQKSNIQLFRLNLIGMVIVLLVLFVTTRYLLKIFLRNPFGKLMERMEQVADGQYHEKSQAYAQEEIRSIVNKFDKMATKIEERETSLKEINLQLEANEKKYREIFNATTETIIIYHKKTGAILEINKAFETLWGYTPGEVHDIRMGKVGLPDKGYNQEEAFDWVKKTASQGLQHFEKQVRRKNGDSFWIEVALKASEIGGEGRVLAVLRDITKRKHDQEALNKAHENLEQKVNERTRELQQQIAERIKITEELNQFREILEGTSDFVGMFDPGGKSILINRAGRRMLEFKDEEDVSNVLISAYHPRKDFERIMSQGIPSAAKEGVWSGEINYINRSGLVIPTWQLLISHKNNKGQLKKISTIARDIRERKKDEMELQKAKEQAEKAKEQAENANKAKSDFLANMSHEIRTPMNAILGFTQIMKNKIKEPKLSHYLESIHSSGKSLLSIINDILDLSKVEAGKMELQYEPVSLQELFIEIGSVFSNKIEDKGLVLKYEIAKGLPGALLLDKERIRQVLINLIGNAVKFTDQGHIKLWVDYRYPEEMQHSTLDLFVSVEDTGIGIPEDQLEEIFGAFEQKKGQKYNQFGGTGLGLAITRGLIELMDGEIKAANRNDHGSIFTITLKQVEVSSMEAISLDKSSIDLVGIDFEKARVLIVDDIEFNRELIRGYLEAYTSLSFVEAVNGLDALEQIRVQRPDIILLDMKMPVMDGYETAEILRSHPKLKSIPVIAVTASALKSDEEVLKKLCADFLKKPVSQYDMIAKLMRYLPYSRGAGPKKINNQTEPLAAEPETAGEPVGDAELKDCTVLVVDDNEINLEIFQEILQSQGVKVSLAHDGLEALEMIQNKNFDAVLMDIQMPNMDGLTATEKIRALQSTMNNIPIISMSASLSDDDRKKGDDLGMNDHVSKPIDPDDLYAVLKKWL